MDLTQNSPCIIGSACRLPGGVIRTDALWPILEQGRWEASSTLPPPSRGFPSYSPRKHTPVKCSGRGGWLNEQGVENFDPTFFGISPVEAATLRPNIRLALELTHEALENAGIPPSSLRGKHVSVSIGVGTEDGWDMKRWKDDAFDAFDSNWAASSDPSGIPGHVAHFFDFRGSCNTVSNACASGAFALRDAIYSLYHENAEIAIVGSLATHFSSAPFLWAAAAGVASCSGRSAAFSPHADGYSPSEGAVFFILKRYNTAQMAGDPIQGIIRALATGHNGKTRSLITPNTAAQVELARKVLQAAKLQPSDITLLEAHGTGTPVGDALEAEAIRSTYEPTRGKIEPLLLSSAKTVFGHCHGAASFVGILKVLTCFNHQMVPAHPFQPLAEFIKGSIILPTKAISLNSERLFAQVNAFGFTGSIASLIIEKGTPSTSSVEPPTKPYPSPPLQFSPLHPQAFFLPFSAKSTHALETHIRNVCSWAIEIKCSLVTLAAILSISRDHYNYRKAIVATSLETLVQSCGITSTKAGIQPPIQFADYAKYPCDYSDDQTSTELLNLENLVNFPFDGTFSREDLDTLLDSRRVLEAACVLYERGHQLHFTSVYSKHHIGVDFLRTFPFYPFERKRYWNDSLRNPQSLEMCPLPNGSVAESLDESLSRKVPFSLQTASLNQDSFDHAISMYGASFSKDYSPKAESTSPDRHVLLTGANGMLGSRFLARILLDPLITVHCVLRGDPWERMLDSFRKHGLAETILQAAHARGSLRLLKCTDLCSEKLGISEWEYSNILENVDTIVHAAWSVNFNLPLAAFEPFISCSRTLAELGCKARKRVRYHFIGSYASTFNYQESLVPESTLEPRLADSLTQGYAISKLITECSLLRIHKQYSSIFDLSVIRIGQICGESVTGSWSQNEMMPMMIASLPVIGAFPSSFPDVSWIPSDICADALRDIVVSPSSPINEGLQIIHLANPHITPWPEIASSIAEIAGLDKPELLPFHQYIKRVREHGHGQGKPLPVSRLLPYFIQSLEEGTLPDKYASLRVSESLKYSPALATCPPIASTILKRIVHHLIPASSTHPPPTVFLFGPWSATAEIPVNQKLLKPIRDRLFGLSTKVRAELNVDVNAADAQLQQQLDTIATQLTVVQDLSNRKITPTVVAGYCFGEYAAAIAAGILSEETAVNILVRRALVLGDITGKMLNVFCELSKLRRAIVCVSSPPDIATIVGPTHIVLSGSESQIESAKEQFNRKNIRSTLVRTKLPFHSALVDSSVRNFAPFQYTPSHSKVTFVSGVVGGSIPPERLTLTYWLRHMREPIIFFGAMQFLRDKFPGSVLVDIGPGASLSKAVERYGWSDFKIITADMAANNFQNHSQQQSNVMRRLRLLTPAPTPSRASSPVSQTTVDPFDIALTLLKDLFGHEPSFALLSQSLHSLGLQSMDFIRFADHFDARTGIHITLSAFVSDAPLETIVREAQTRN